MDNKSPYVLIGAAMMLFISAVVGFVIWKLRAGDRTSYFYYVTYFSGDVQGLAIDSPVYYRGLLKGRVRKIELEPITVIQRSTARERRSERVKVTMAVAPDVQLYESSYAVFEKPLIAGASYIQISGRLEGGKIDQKKLDSLPYPEIRGGASFAQDLQTKIGATLNQLNVLLSPDNIAAVSSSLKSLDTTLAGIAKQDKAIQDTLAGLPVAIAEFKQTFAKINTVADSLNLVAMELGPQDDTTRKALAGRDPSELKKAILDARHALGQIDAASIQLNQMITGSKAPIQQFSENGLVELSYAIRELRQLTANLNIIAAKIERDPAGFVFSGKQGYVPK